MARHHPLRQFGYLPNHRKHRRGGSKQLITHETLTDLSQGANQILLYSLDDYRLSGKELCFEVHVFIDGKKIPLDAPRRFCARTIDRGWWSMR
jgi:hypothetical protein